MMLISAIPDFDYVPGKGRFRNFLLKIVFRRITDMYKREKWYCSLSSETNADWIEHIEDEGVETCEEEWNRLWKHNLFLQALDRVKEKVSPLSYTSFERYALKGQAAEEVAASLNIDKNVLFQTKNRMIKLLRKEVEILREELGDV